MCPQACSHWRRWLRSCANPHASAAASAFARSASRSGVRTRVLGNLTCDAPTRHGLVLLALPVQQAPPWQPCGGGTGVCPAINICGLHTCATAFELRLHTCATSGFASVPGTAADAFGEPGLSCGERRPEPLLARDGALFSVSVQLTRSTFCLRLLRELLSSYVAGAICETPSLVRSASVSRRRCPSASGDESLTALGRLATWAMMLSASAP